MLCAIAYSPVKNNCFDLIIYSLNKSEVWVLLLDSIVDRLEINANKHAATIKTITLNTFKTVYFNSAACRSSIISDWAARSRGQSLSSLT